MFFFINYFLRRFFPKTQIGAAAAQPPAAPAPAAAQIDRKFQLKISQLPIEIRNKIISYTYSPQPQNLCNDIKDFSQSFEKVFMKYKEIFHDDKECREWITNNIISFFNEFQPTMFGLVLQLKNIIHRNPFVKTPFQEFHLYMYASPKILWGLLTQQERDTFIHCNIL